MRGGLADILSQPEPRSWGPAALGSARAGTAAATIMPPCLGADQGPFRYGRDF